MLSELRPGNSRRITRKPQAITWVSHLMIRRGRSIVLRPNTSVEIMPVRDSENKPLPFPHSFFEINIVSNSSSHTRPVLHPPEPAAQMASGPIPPPFPADPARPTVVVSISHSHSGSDLSMIIVNFQSYRMSELMYFWCPPIPVIFIEDCQGIHYGHVLLILSIVYSEIGFNLLMVRAIMTIVIAPVLCIVDIRARDFKVPGVSALGGAVGMVNCYTQQKHQEG